ncbi:mitochondrial 2-oxodicarboxylate carrier isoform X5 [Caretta caretta]|uniref:mitochondrial 2-oxodicarboxylate carrier isoform X5 n=1 Tax=Caretta caretta TaxID=8467 RepID=UPI003F4BE839
MKITSSDPHREILKRSDHLLLFCITLLSLVEICLMHPLDVVKTRFQIQRGKTDPTSYKSLGDSFRTIFRTEGWFGFYKGILPPIMAETPKRAVKFFTFEQYKKLLGHASLSPGLTFAVAGLGSGLTEAVVVNPFEVVKVSLQANRNAFTEQPSTFVQARRIITTDGLGFRGLNKGLTATLGRHGVFNMVYFGFYFNVKNIIPVNEWESNIDANNYQMSDGLDKISCFSVGAEKSRLFHLFNYSQVFHRENQFFHFMCFSRRKTQRWHGVS